MLFLFATPMATSWNWLPTDLKLDHYQIALPVSAIEEPAERCEKIRIALCLNSPTLPDGS